MELMKSQLPWMQAVGTGLTVAGQFGAGLSAADAGRSEASQLRYAAGQSRASAQRAAIEERRQAKLAMSRGRAVAAASGGGAADPTVVDTLSDVAAEGEYRALSALYEGEERAAGLEHAADVAKSEGRARRAAGFLGGAGTLLSGGVDWFEKYGS